MSQGMANSVCFVVGASHSSCAAMAGRFARLPPARRWSANRLGLTRHELLCLPANLRPRTFHQAVIGGNEEADRLCAAGGVEGLPITPNQPGPQKRASASAALTSLRRREVKPSRLRAIRRDWRSPGTFATDRLFPRSCRNRDARTSFGGFAPPTFDHGLTGRTYRSRSAPAPRPLIRSS